MEKGKPNPKRKKRIYLELFCLILGGYMTYSGVINEMNHVSSVSYNSKGSMFVHTGAYDALLGILIVIGSICSIYAKFKNKSNQ